MKCCLRSSTTVNKSDCYIMPKIDTWLIVTDWSHKCDNCGFISEIILTKSIDIGLVVVVIEGHIHRLHFKTQCVKKNIQQFDNNGELAYLQFEFLEHIWCLKCFPWVRVKILNIHTRDPYYHNWSLMKVWQNKNF
jgi:hypothetical protein